MISRSQRINTAQFEEALEKGRIVHSPLFILRLLGNRKETRMAAVVSKKVQKTAVGRNRLRRRIYECVRSIGLPEVKSHIIIFGKEASVKAAHADLKKDLHDVFVKAGILR